MGKTIALPGTVFPTYRSQPLLAIEPNWVREPGLEHLRTLDVFAALGRDVAATGELKPRRRFVATWTGLDRAALTTVAEFFHTQAGRARPFWFPSFRTDLTLSAAIAAGNTHIHVVDDADYETSWLPNDTVGRHLFIQLPNGSYVCKKVNSVTDDTQLNLDAAVGLDCAAAGIRRVRVSFLYYVRFDQDDLVISYDTPTVGDVELAMISVIGEDA